MKNSNQQTIETLNHLVAIAKDGKEGYKNAVDEVKDYNMKVIFKSFAYQKNRYMAQLQQQISRLGGSSEPSKNSAGTINHTWMDIKSVFRPNDKTAVIINVCITNEEAAIKKYAEALSRQSIDSHIRVIMQEQLLGIEQTIDKIKLKRKKKKKFRNKI